MKRFKTPRGAFFLLLAVCCVLLAYYLMNLKAEKNKLPVTENMPHVVF